jgi:hypothetical protein
VTQSLTQFKFNKSEARKIAIYSNMSTVFSSGSFNISKALSKFDSQGAQEKKMRHLQRPKKKLMQSIDFNK